MAATCLAPPPMALVTRASSSVQRAVDNAGSWRKACCLPLACAVGQLWSCLPHHVLPAYSCPCSSPKHLAFCVQGGAHGHSQTCSTMCTTRLAYGASALPRRTPGAPAQPSSQHLAHQGTFGRSLTSECRRPKQYLTGNQLRVQVFHGAPDPGMRGAAQDVRVLPHPLPERRQRHPAPDEVRALLAGPRCLPQARCL